MRIVRPDEEDGRVVLKDVGPGMMVEDGEGDLLVTLANEPDDFGFVSVVFLDEEEGNPKSFKASPLRPVKILGAAFFGFDGPGAGI